MSIELSDENNVTNFYSHCGERWELSECDSFHNDECPVCCKEIEPYESIVHGDKDKVVKH